MIEVEIGDFTLWGTDFGETAIGTSAVAAYGCHRRRTQLRTDLPAK